MSAAVPGISAARLQLVGDETKLVLTSTIICRPSSGLVRIRSGLFPFPCSIDCVVGFDLNTPTCPASETCKHSDDRIVPVQRALGRNCVPAPQGMVTCSVDLGEGRACLRPGLRYPGLRGRVARWAHQSDVTVRPFWLRRHQQPPPNHGPELLVIRAQGSVTWHSPPRVQIALV